MLVLIKSVKNKNSEEGLVIYEVLLFSFSFVHLFAIHLTSLLWAFCGQNHVIIKTSETLCQASWCCSLTVKGWYAAMKNFLSKSSGSRDTT